MTSKTRALNALERKIHKAGMSAQNNVLSQKELEDLAPNPSERLEAINFLLKTELFRVLQDAKKNSSFKAIMPDELKIKKEMGGEESLVLSQIKAAGNEGIWTKHLKVKTELHQTVVNRCLKALEQKQLIKSIKSVKHPTRKIYMMFNFEPSVEVTGGPWYTDNELDTEFISMLSSVCLRYIRDRTIPRGSLSAAPNTRKLYAISSAPPYPTADEVHSFLRKSRITDTEFDLQHIEKLLDVLVYDRLVERLPAFGSALWNPDAFEITEEASDDEHEKERKTRRKRSKTDIHKESDQSSDSNSDPGPRKKIRKIRDASETENSSSPRKLTRKREREGSEEGSIEETSKRQGKRRRQDDVGDVHVGEPEIKSGYTFSEEPDLQSAVVYRALHPSEGSGTFGWSEAPCSRCQQFDFCDSGSGLVSPDVLDLEEGPVNARNCIYYSDWLSG